METVDQNGRPYNAVLTDVVFGIATDPNSSNKDRLAAIEFITKYAYGSPVSTNINADITANPFDGIDTSKLESFRAKLMESSSK